MTSNLCQGGPIFTVKSGPGPGFSGGSKYSVTPGRVIQSAVRLLLQYLHLKLHVQMECHYNISNILITWGNHYDGMAT